MNPLPTVLLEPDCLAGFFHEALVQYRTCTPPRCWGVLVGRHTGETIVVARVCRARNVRRLDGDALHEFNVACAGQFGKVYANPRRGFWADSLDVLRLMREAAATGEDVLGSIHLHPDWHRIGPADERTMIVSEKPTPLDEYLFRSTAWPLNIILYVEQRRGALHHAWGAWAPPPGEVEDSVRLPIRWLAHEQGKAAA